MCLLFIFLCTSCESLSKLNPWTKNNAVETISVKVQNDLGVNYAIAIDVLFIYTERGLELLADVDSQRWFAQKSMLTSALAADIDIIGLELVPNARQDDLILPIEHQQALAVIALAYVPDWQQTKVTITHLAHPQLTLGNGQLTAD